MKLYVFAVANYLTKRFGQEYRGRGFKFSALAITTKGDNSLHIQKSVGGWI